MIQKTKKENFYTWFTGFVEGDGSCFVTARGELGFDLTQDLSSLEAFLTLKNTLGFGTVTQRQTLTTYANGKAVQRNVCVFTVSSKTDFVRLTQIFNGRFLSVEKQQALVRWMHVLKFRHNLNFSLACQTQCVSFNNAWLSGFIDAEGCFYASLRKCKTAFGVTGLCAHNL